MYAFALVISFVALLAGRVAAFDLFNITVNSGGLVNVTASSLLTFNDTQLNDACSSDCSDGKSFITACGDFNATCLCSDTTAAAIMKCEQCYFQTLIKENRRMPDPRAGNSVVINSYAAGCKDAHARNPDANVSIPTNITLSLPADWDGPFGQGLNTGATAVGVIVAFALGVGAITVVNTM